MKRISSLLLVLILMLFYPRSNALAQGTAFTYQGRLNDGTNPANGIYDLVFVIYDAPTGAGVFANLFNYATPISNGLFTVTLDFGTGMFPGADRWLEVGVRTNGGSTFTMMSPRQKFTATPYAIAAGNLTGVVPSAGLAGTYSGAVTLNNSANSFSGNGGGLTNLTALTLSGLAAGNFWQLGGNNASPQAFLGTTNNQAFEIKVNGMRVLRLEPDPRSNVSAGNLVGGFTNNLIEPGSGGNVIGGGGFPGGANIIHSNSFGVFIGAGSSNEVGPFSNDGVIAGGFGNTIQTSAHDSTIGGGRSNMIQANSTHGTIAGGHQNNIGSGSEGTTIGGGIRNTVQTGAYYSTIDGGTLNTIGINAVFSAIGGGIQNTIEESAFYSAIGGGAFDTIQTNAAWSMIGGGSFNLIQPYASYSTIGGGKSNSIQANSIYGTIAGGEANVVAAGYANVSGGWSNSIADARPSPALVGAGGISSNIRRTVLSAVVSATPFRAIQCGPRLAAAHRTRFPVGFVRR